MLWIHNTGISYIILSAAINSQLTFHSLTTSPSLAERTKGQRAESDNTEDRGEAEECRDEENVKCVK